MDQVKEIHRHTKKKRARRKKFTKLRFHFGTFTRILAFAFFVYPPTTAHNNQTEDDIRPCTEAHSPEFNRIA